MVDSPLKPGLYELLLDHKRLEELRGPIAEGLAEMAALDPAASPAALSGHFAGLLLTALRSTKEPSRPQLLNDLLQALGLQDLARFVLEHTLPDEPQVLLSLKQRSTDISAKRPLTPLHQSSLFTGSPEEPQLDRELAAELLSADRVDILVSFVKLSGLRLLQPALAKLSERGVPVRIITTCYMGASDPKAVAWLADQPGFFVKVSYDTERTRLHAKAYHFFRESGFSTAYIGSANMSQPAMTSGLEWTVKVTSQDAPQLLTRFQAEFESYWANPQFEDYVPDSAHQFRLAIARARGESMGKGADSSAERFFSEIRPYSYQVRILEALAAERAAGYTRNLVVAATGTGKTVIAAFDYASHMRAAQPGPQPTLLFVAHRREILEQARGCFQHVLRDANFGELLADGRLPTEWRHVFASIQSLHLLAAHGLSSTYFHTIILDEAHHSPAESYRKLFQDYQPQILLGLTATPERMDGQSVLPDFHNRFAAEIRLPEALEEKLLCPFHYFGVTDPVSLADESFWKNGRYSTDALTQVYTGDDIRSRQRLDVIQASLDRYVTDLESMRALAFCASVKHAEYMANHFSKRGYRATFIVGETSSEERDQRLKDFRQGRIQILFSVDVFSEGVDVPEVDVVLFLRPTQSLTIFLQQLGRGLRHAAGKEVLTVLDFVGQAHRNYRVDRKYAALLRHDRRRIDEEIEADFPSLPPGCSIQLERIAKEHVVNHIRQTLHKLSVFVPECLRTFTSETGLPLSLGAFLNETGLSPLQLFRSQTWSEWKALAFHESKPQLGHREKVLSALRRISTRDDPELHHFIASIFAPTETKPDAAALAERLQSTAPGIAKSLHYLLWGDWKTAASHGIAGSISSWMQDESGAADVRELSLWKASKLRHPTAQLALPMGRGLRLHASYGQNEIKAEFGLADLNAAGPTGVGVMPVNDSKVILLFVTLVKEERYFSPTTRYQDCLISPTQLQWETQAATTQKSELGQKFLHFKERGYTLLFFVRHEKKTEGETSPFLFIGPAAKLLSAKGDRPIRMLWELAHPVPAAFYETARVA